MRHKVKEYEYFCKNPNFLDWVMAKKVFTLHLVLNNANLSKYTQNKNYIELIPESNIIIALIGLEKDGFVKCEDLSGDRCLEYVTELNQIITTINIDKNVSRELDAFLGPCSEKFISYLNKTREIEIRTRLLRIAASKEQQKELQKKVDKLGGLVFYGLYHRGRRVMARVEPNGRKWLLSGDENDLISMIGGNEIKKGMNKIDLLNKYGLQENKEVAPVKFNIDESGHLTIERDDLWGEKATLYTDKTTFMQRVINDLSWNDVLTFLFMPHMSIALFITERISTNTTKILLFLTIFFLILTGSTYGRNLHLNYIEQIWFSLTVLYLLIPIIIIGTEVLSSNDD